MCTIQRSQGPGEQRRHTPEAPAVVGAPAQLVEGERREGGTAVPPSQRGRRGDQLRRRGRGAHAWEAQLGTSFQ